MTKPAIGYRAHTYTGGALMFGGLGLMAGIGACLFVNEKHMGKTIVLFTLIGVGTGLLYVKKEHEREEK